MSGPIDREPNGEGEPTGLPEDLLTNPDKYDGDMPLWRKTVGLIRQCQTVRPNKRGQLLGQFAQSLVKTPVNIIYAFENLGLIGQVKPDQNSEAIQEQLLRSLESAFSQRSLLATWTPEKIEELVKVGVSAPEKQIRIFDRGIAALMNAPRSVNEAVDLFYNVAWAMVKTPDHKIRELLFSVLCLETSALTENSPSNVYFSCGIYAEDDVRLGKYQSTLDAINHVGILLEFLAGEEYHNGSNRLHERIFRENHWSQASNELDEKIGQELYRKNPSRVTQLFQAYENAPTVALEALSESSRGETYLDMRKKRMERENEFYDSNANWPYNIMRDPNEALRRLLRYSIGPLMYKNMWEVKAKMIERDGLQSLTPRGIDITSDLLLRVYAKGALSEEQKKDLTREVRETILNGKSKHPKRELHAPMDEVLDEVRSPNLFGFSHYFDKKETILFAIQKAIPQEVSGKLASIIEYHRPSVLPEQLQGIYSQTESIRDDLKNKFTRAVGKRGCQVIIADTSLRAMGYESLLFSQTGNLIDTKISIDGQIFTFSLGSDYKIILGKDVLRFLSIQDQAWLELLTLSHLKKVLCTQEEDMPEELVGGQEQYASYRRQAVHTTEHLRWYKGSKRKYTQDAFEKCLKSGLPIRNLHIINEMRAKIGWGGTPETGYWTYVRGTEIDIDTMAAKPVRVAYKNAADDIRQVVPLNDVSPEEIVRIEREILAHLVS